MMSLRVQMSSYMLALLKYLTKLCAWVLGAYIIMCLGTWVRLSYSLCHGFAFEAEVKS